MNFELLAIALGASATLIRLLADSDFVKPLFERIGKNKIFEALFDYLGVELPSPIEPYQERLSKLVKKFDEVMGESDSIITELEGHLRAKETVVRKLEVRENELTSRINQLREAPEVAAIRNQELLEEVVNLQQELQKSQAKEGKRSIWRDFILFALGVLLPYLINWFVPMVGLPLPVSP